MSYDNQKLANEADAAGPSNGSLYSRAQEAKRAHYEHVQDNAVSVPVGMTYSDLRSQFKRLTTQRAHIDGKIALLSQLLSLFE